MTLIERIVFFGLSTFLLYSIAFSSANSNEESEMMETPREKKILNIFSVVRFNNEACSTADNTNGTCYTADECSNRGGSSSGSCASGYGVCCVFTLGCGRTSAENCTYFVSSGNEAGMCSIEICPCSDNICQLRLDFSSFVIGQPSTSSLSVAKIQADVDVASQSQCLMDTFAVSNPGGSSPPTICGTNSGEHMYVDSSDSCNTLFFNLGSAASNAQRTWNIKITQFSCDYDNLAPDGCTQFFFGAATGTVKTYNFDGGQHLANQDQEICIRRERGNCRICWSSDGDGDFELSSATEGATGMVKTGSGCCGYGNDAAGKAATGYDCVMIPSASKKTDNNAALAAIAAYGLCGAKFGSANGAAVTICSKSVPFNIRFLSDNYDWSTTEGTKSPNGFKLFYEMFSCP